MATPPASDEQTDGPNNGSEAAVSVTGPFNALTDDLNDLRIRHQHCWLWPQISLEIDRLDDVLKDGRHLLEPLATDQPDWAIKTCAGIEEEMVQAGVGHENEDEIVELRGDIAGWERWNWHYAAQQVGTAERFLIIAGFAAGTPDSSAIKKAEAQIATLERKARAARAEMVPYRQGRKRGAVNRLTRALMAVVKEAGSSEYAAVIEYLDGAYGEEFEGIIFRDIVNDRLEYSDLSKNRETSIAIDTLKRKLQQLPDV